MVDVISADLQGKLGPVGPLQFVRADWWAEAPSFVLLRYTLSGDLQELGVRMDLDKRAFIDDLDDPDLNREVRNAARDVWSAVASTSLLHDRRRPDGRGGRPEAASQPRGETVVAAYDTAAHAALVEDDLRAANIPTSAISVYAPLEETGPVQTNIGAPPAQARSFWAGFFGEKSDRDAEAYDRLSGGFTVVTVRVTEANASKVMAILENHQPLDSDERATDYELLPDKIRSAPVPSEGRTVRPKVIGISAAPIPSGGSQDETLPLAEESVVVVGKQLVNRGGMRIRRYVVETPIEEQLSLRYEHVVVDRRAVMDGPMAKKAFADSEKVIEMTETTEVPVVSKTTRVTEEVVLRKEGVDRTETIRDTVRSEKAEVVRHEQLPPAK